MSVHKGRDSVSPEMLLLFERSLRGEGLNAPSVRLRLQRRHRPDTVPVSYAQKRLWFLYQMEGPSATYNVALALRLVGSLDEAALEEAMADLISRHESLRTRFPMSADVPRQEVLAIEGIGDFFIKEEIAESHLGTALREASAYGFALEREIPVRAWLFRVSGEQHVLLLLMHHIATDGWSLAPLTRDLAAAYAARSRGGVPQWEPLPVQYADYTLWQQELLGEETDTESIISGQVQYWRQNLAGLPEEIEIPKDRVRPEVASYRGGNAYFRVDAGLHQKLLTVARDNQVSLFMVLQAGVAALLTRMGAGEDIPIGSPIAGRTDDALDEVVGFFVNTLVLRTDTSGDPGFSELLARVRETDLCAYSHQDVPFERLVEVLNPARSLNRHPLFQVMLVLQNNARGSLELPGVKVVPLAAGSPSAKFDLTFTLSENRSGGRAEGIEGQLNYAVDLFEGATVERMGARLVRLLEAVAGDPSERIGSIDILGGAEREEILREWNDTGRAVPESTLPELFEGQVEKSGEATAVVFEETRLTYAELNRRANQVAHLLIEQGVGPESIVALAVPRSIEMIVGLLGILKAGAAYLPLDAEYPKERLAFMLEDARPACVLTVCELAGELAEQGRLVVLDGEETREALASKPGSNPGEGERVQALRASHPAYVIYTSGSTGTPKGVVVTEAAIVNRLVWMQSAYALRWDDCVLQKTPSSFDVSVWEFFWPLIEGAQLLLNYLRTLVGEELIATLNHYAVSHALIPPTVLNSIDADHLESFQSLIVGGEACPSELVG